MCAPLRSMTAAAASMHPTGTTRRASASGLGCRGLERAFVHEKPTWDHRPWELWKVMSLHLDSSGFGDSCFSAQICKMYEVLWLDGQNCSVLPSCSFGL